MTVSTSTNKAGPYAGAGLPGPFTVPFRFLSASHLQVIKTSTAGIDTVLTLTTDYTVAGVGAATGSVTLTAPLASGERLTIIRDVPFTQLADYVNNDSFPAESHEDALDLLTMQGQQLKERVDAALTLPATVVGADTELPFPQSNKLIGWNDAGTGLQNFDATTLATIVAFGTSRADTFAGNGTQTQFALTNNPGALANLDVAVGGVTQTPGVDYTFSGTTLTFISGAPANGAPILARYFLALPQGVTDSAAATFLQAGAGASPRNVQSKLRDVVSVLDFGAVGDGATNNSTAIALAIASGHKRLHVPEGVYALSSPISATLSDSLVLEGEGVLLFTGANNTNMLLTIQCAGFGLTVRGLRFDGDDRVAGGLRIENTAALVDDSPVCSVESCSFIDFRMNNTSIRNIGLYISGSFNRVDVVGNRFNNITRAAGTGTPGVNGTTGAFVTNYDATKIVRSCIHKGNFYTNISGGDAVGSANNVDFDAFKFYAPNPTNNDNADATVSSYLPSTCWSSENTYRNVRGRSVKVQALATVIGEKIIRDADYTIFGGSTEINLQYGAGTVRDIEFFFEDYAGPTSPLQTAGHVLVGFAQNVWYDEDNGGVSVSGIRVYNNIKTGVGQPIQNIVGATVSGAALGKDKPLVRVSDVVVNRGDVGWVLTIAGDTGTDGLVVLQDINVARLLYSAIGTSFAGSGFRVIASGVYNLDGVITPANAKKFVTDLVGPGNDISFTGTLHGSGTYGFLNTYNRGADFTYAPMLVDAALTGTGLAGAASVQTIRLANDASHTFARRFFNASRGLVIVSVDFDYTSQGVFACGSNGVYQIAAHASNVFSASTTGSNLDTAARLNMWFTGGALNIKNRLGTTYSITVMFVG